MDGEVSPGIASTGIELTVNIFPGGSQAEPMG